jgi:3-oxoacyl-(acyl-carrier-protein) synthase
MVSPLGHTVEDSWEGIKAGRSGVARITRYDASQHQVQIAAEVKNWNAADFMDGKEVRRRDRNQHFIIAASQEAMRHSGLEITDENRRKTGVIVGSSVGGVESYYDQAKIMIETGDLRRVTPFAIPMLMVNGGSGMVSIDIGAMGPSCTPISACATGADCIGFALDLIRSGRIDRALAGGGEAPISLSGLRPLTALALYLASTMTQLMPLARSTRIARVWFSVKAQASWCWKNWKARKHAARTSWPNSPVMALRLTLITSPRRTPKRTVQVSPSRMRWTTPESILPIFTISMRTEPQLR